MPYAGRLLIPVFAAGCVLGVAQQASKPQLTARELFYSAATAPTPAAKTAPATTPVAPPKAPPKSSKTASAKRPAPKPVPAAGAGAPPTGSKKIESATLPDGGVLIPAIASTASTAPAPDTGTALGLKYTILKLSGNDMVPVPPDSVFHAGDRIQFDVQTNGPGYLYIVSQGTSGTWKPMFPSTEVEDGNNRVDGWHSYTMPPKSRMVFDEQTGVEKIFIVFSREPETDLESMIYSLQGGKAKPVVQPQAPKQLVQIAGIDDATVGHLRSTYARDLIIERVDDKTPADTSDKKESAVYIVNPSGSQDSRVVADLKLVHQ